jgi:hypothetical protein
VGYTKRLGLFRQPQTGSTLLVGERSFSPVNKSQAIEIKKRLPVAQQGLLVKVEMIQSSFQLTDHILENVSLREREVGATRVVFQEAIIARMRNEISSSSNFPISE